MQSPIGNPPAAGPGTNWAPVSTVTLPLGGIPAGASNPVLSELPSLPPPPFINYHEGATAPTPPPPQAATTAQSLPVAEIPPPHMAAPWVFTQIPKAPPPQIIQQPGPPMPPPLPPQQSWPQESPQPPQEQPPQTPSQPASKAPQNMPTEPVDLSPLNDAVIRSLNKRLNNIDNEEERTNASIDFFKILDKHPYLSEDPVYKPYVDAFMQKIMGDSSPLVRTGAELAMQLGKVKHPPPPVVSELQRMATPKGPLDFESGTAASILEHLNGANIIQEKPALPSGNPGMGGQQASIKGAKQAPAGGAQTDPARLMQAMTGQQSQTETGETDSAQLAQLMDALAAQQNQPDGNQQPDPAQMAQMMQALTGRQNPLPKEQNTDPLTQLMQIGRQNPGSLPAMPMAPPGEKLNIMSPQRQTMPAQGMNPPGQRFNMTEGG